jgi:hypothetical protein
MANAYRSATNLWEVDSPGKLSADAANLGGRVTIERIIYIPSVADDDLVFEDGTANENAIVLKAGASDASPIHLDFSPRGRKVRDLECLLIDGGTAYVYLM